MLQKTISPIVIYSIASIGICCACNAPQSISELPASPKSGFRAELLADGRISIHYFNGNSRSALLDTFQHDYVVKEKGSSNKSYASGSKLRIPTATDWAVVPPGTTISWNISAWDNTVPIPLQEASEYVVQSNINVPPKNVLNNVSVPATLEFPKELPVSKFGMRQSK